MIEQQPAPVVAEVVVQGARLPPAAGDPAFSIVRLDAADLERQPRLDDVLKQAPGVSLFRRTSSLGANPTTQGLSLRSIAPSGAGRALVLLDGAPQNDPFGGWVIWTGLPSEGLAGADIVRGAGAGAYGAGALTGTVSLDSLSAAGAPFRADAHVGELGGARAALAVGGAAGGEDGLGVLATFAGERSGGWTPVRERRGRADEPLGLKAVSGSLKLERKAGAAAGAARLAAWTETRDAGLAGAGSRAQGLQGALTLARAPEPGRFGLRLQAWGTGSDLANRSVAVAADRNTTTPANDQFETPAWGAGANAALRRSGPAGEWELGADVRLAEGEVRERFRFIGGGFTRLREAGGRTAIAGAYVDGTRRAGPWLLTAGLRADAWEAAEGRRRERDLASGALTLDARPEGRREVVPTARAGVRRAVGEGGFVRAAAYAGFRPPTLNELHRPFRVGNDITEANGALKPERLYGAEIGAGREAGPFTLQATVFLNRLEEPIANVTVGFGPGTFPLAGFVPAGGVLRQRRNVGRIEAAGLEAEASAALTERLQLRAALGWTAAEVDGGTDAPQLTGRRPAQAPRTTATAALDWAAVKRLALGLSARFESARFEDDLNTRRLDAALAVDAQVRWRLTSASEAYLAADNLLDADVQTGRTADGVIANDQPRTIRVGLAYRR